MKTWIVIILFSVLIVGVGFFVLLFVPECIWKGGKIHAECYEGEVMAPYWPCSRLMHCQSALSCCIPESWVINTPCQQTYGGTCRTWCLEGEEPSTGGNQGCPDGFMCCK